MKPLSKLLGTAIVVGMVLPAIGQTHWQTHRNTEYQFRFLYPPDWTFGTPRGPRVRATLFPPAEAPRANCNIVVGSLPAIAGMSQADLNRQITAEALSASDWKSMMGEKWPDFRLHSSSHTKVDNQPAYLGLFEHSHETVDRRTYVKALVVATFTPGKCWVFSCAAKGNSPAEARNAYQHWEGTFRRIVGSLVFEDRFDATQMSPTHSPVAPAGPQLSPEWLVENLVAQATFAVLTTLIIAALLFLPLRMWRLPKGRAGAILGLTVLIFGITEPLLNLFPKMKYSDALPIPYCIVVFLLVHGGLKSRPLKDGYGEAES